MNLVLDTHALLWWLMDDPALPSPARRAIEDETNVVFVSAASAFEVTTKYRIGKLPDAAVLAMNFGSVIEDEGFRPLPIGLAHATLAGSLRNAHKDPFDRLLIAQFLLDAMSLVSNELLFEGFGVTRVW